MSTEKLKWIKITVDKLTYYYFININNHHFLQLIIFLVLVKPIEDWGAVLISADWPTEIKFSVSSLNNWFVMLMMRWWRVEMCLEFTIEDEEHLVGKAWGEFLSENSVILLLLLLEFSLLEFYWFNYRFDNSTLIFAKLIDGHLLRF